MQKEILRLDNVVTEYNQQTNLDDFNLHMFQGEILGLVGINDQGKEALIDLICQNKEIKFGRVYIAETLVNSYRNSDDTWNKVYVIDKKNKLVDDLTVCDNVFVLRKGFKKYFIDKKILQNQFILLLKEIREYVDPTKICAELTEYERCVVEIVKATIQGTQLIIASDLSNALSNKELKKLHKLFQFLSQKGYSILCIESHHQEVFSFCDRVAFMKDGKIKKIFEKEEMSDENVFPYIISFYDNLEEEKYKKNRVVYKPHLLLASFKNIKFDIKTGECVVLFDVGTSLPFEISEKDMKSKDIAIIEQEPLNTMLFYEKSYMENLIFLLDKKIKGSFISNKIKKSIKQEFQRIVGNEIYESNIQKLEKKSLYNLIYYRVYLLNPKIVIITQPFVNADMYLRKHITDLIRVLKRKGIAIIIIAISISDSLFAADKLILTENGVVKEEVLPDEFHTIRWLK